MAGWCRAMIQLPSNVTTALLALALGVVIGAGGSHLLSGERSVGPIARMGEVEGTAVIEKERPIAPRDTSGQEEPDVEIRYKVRRDTVYEDTLQVPVPSSLPSRPILSDRTPLDITDDRVRHSYYDIADRRWETRVYTIPEDNLSLGAFATVEAQSAIAGRPLAVDRIWTGGGLRLRWRRLEASVEALTTPLLKHEIVRAGLRYHFD